MFVYGALFVANATCAVANFALGQPGYGVASTAVAVLMVLGAFLENRQR